MKPTSLMPRWTGVRLAVERLEDRAQPSLLAPRSFDTDLYRDSPPNSIAVGDFNGDGHLDLTTASGLVSVQLGDGSGGFGPPRTFSAGARPSSVLVADFNGDDRPDLATANSGTRNVSILLGNGDGAFQSARSVAVRLAPSSLAAGDFNNDGFVDLAVGPGPQRTVTILLGNGDGSLQGARELDAGLLVNAMAVGDFNDDGNLDLVAGNADFSPQDNVATLLGNGDGTFQSPRILSADRQPRSVAVGDFNADGWHDLAVVNAGSNSVSVFLGLGDGTFQAPRQIPVGTSPWSVALGDLNGDGMLDLVVAKSRSDHVYVLLGLGDGEFHSTGGFPTGTTPVAVGLGDFNEDGVSDIAAANYGSNSVAVLLGVGDGSFPTLPSYPAGNRPSAVVTGDYNQDGLRDLAVSSVDTGTVNILLGIADGTLRAGGSFPAGNTPVSLVQGDFNGDSLADFAVVNFGENRLSILLGRGDGTFQPPRGVQVGESDDLSALALGDFDNDGKPDLVVVHRTTVSNHMSVLFGNGDGSFQDALSFRFPFIFYAPVLVAVGEFNGDGIHDLVVVPVSGPMHVLQGNGDGTFRNRGEMGSSPSFPSSVVLEDFNGDGRQDIAVTGTQTFVRVHLGNGDGSFQSARDPFAGVGPYSLAVGDLNGDGVADLAVASSGAARVCLGVRNGWVLPTHVSHTTSGLAAIDDFNADGMPDVALVNATGVTLLFNDGWWPTLPGPGSSPGLVADFSLSPVVVVGWSVKPLPTSRCLPTTLAWLPSADTPVEAPIGSQHSRMSPLEVKPAPRAAAAGLFTTFADQLLSEEKRVAWGLQEAL